MKRGLQAVAVATAFSAIAFCAIALRVYCRFGLLKRTGPDDYLAIAALAFSVTLTVFITLQQQNGLGQHFRTLHNGEYEQMSKYFWVSVPMYYIGLTTIKSSVILQLLRFLIDSRIRLFCWALLVLICSYGLAAVLVSLLACMPVAYFWDKSIGGGHCINLLAFWYSNAAFNIITDIVVVAIPLSVLRSLLLPKRQKYGLLFVFALGGFTCITSILRLHSINVIANSNDVTWDNVGAATWSAVELNTAIICACLPTLKPIIDFVFPRLLGAHSGIRSRNSAPIQVSRQVQRRYEGLGSSPLPNRTKQDSKYEWEITGPHELSV